MVKRKALINYSTSYPKRTVDYATRMRKLNMRKQQRADHAKCALIGTVVIMIILAII